MEQDDGRLQLYLRHRRVLIDYATSITGDRMHAEDIVQDAFARFVLPRNQTKSALAAVINQPVAYLYRIVRNLALDGRRQAARENRRAGGDFETVAQTVRDAKASPEMELLHRQELNIVMAALAELPERSRVALEMYRLEGCKLKDIAARLDISIGLAHALVAEGLIHCRARLDAALKTRRK